MNRIALFLPNWIGDVVMATPAVRAIRDAFPEADLVAVCKPYVADVLGGNPWFRDVIHVDKRGPRSRRLLAVSAKLRENRPDAANSLSEFFPHGLIARLAGCRKIVGFVRYGRGLLLTNRLHAKADSNGRLSLQPAIDDYNRLALELGTTQPGFRMQLFTRANR